MRVVLVRPWRDAHGGGGCCTGELSGGIVFEQRVGAEGTHAEQAHCEHPQHTDVVAAAYRLLRRHLPEVDVQIVGSDNVAFLLPWSFRAARQRIGARSALRHAMRSTTAGAVLVDGVVAGDIEDLGAQGVLEVVRRQAGNGTSSTAATV